MTTLRFHTELYSRTALDEAMRVFADHATIERRQDEPYEEISIDGEQESEVAGEFGNYVLALTVDENRS